jgi:predicted RecA/RadA family phage recombinase
MFKEELSLRLSRPLLSKVVIWSGQGGIVGVAACDAEVGERLEIRAEGVFEIPKLAPADVLAAVSIGKATFTAGVGKVGAAGTHTIGWIVETSGAGSTTAKVRLIPATAAVTAAAED